MLQKEVIEAGKKMASDLFDAQISKDMGTSGGHVVKDMSEYDNGDLIQKYLDGKIVSVEAIYTAMKRVEEKFKSTNNRSDEIAWVNTAFDFISECCNKTDAQVVWKKRKNAVVAQLRAVR